MTKTNLIKILVLEAILGVIFCILGATVENSFTSIFAFPFEQIGYVLRFLSLHSSLGNIVAIIIYTLISLSPFLVILKKHKFESKDCLLVLLSILLFITLYMMINPSIMASHFGSVEILPLAKTMFGISIYTVVFGYIIFTILNKIDLSTTDSMSKILNILLVIVCATLGLNIFWIELSSLIKNFETLQLGNTDYQNLNLSYAFLVLQYLVDILPSILNIVIIVYGYGIIDALQNNIYSNEVSINAQKTVSICRKSIIVIITSQIVINILQLLLGDSVRASNYTLQIPLISIVFVLVVMLISKYFEEARKVKEDNDMII